MVMSRVGRTALFPDPGAEEDVVVDTVSDLREARVSAEGEISKAQAGYRWLGAGGQPLLTCCFRHLLRLRQPRPGIYSQGPGNGGGAEAGAVR